MKPSEVAIAVGHFNMPSAARLNLHLLRKHLSPSHPILVTDDCSPPLALVAIAEACELYDAQLQPGTERLGHVGGDLRAFHGGLEFARERGCKYLMKLSQRAMFDLADWLMPAARSLHAWRMPAAGAPASIPAGTVAHVRTSAILLDVAAWSREDILEELTPRVHGGIACEWLVGRCLQRLGGTFLKLEFVSQNLTAAGPGELWHDEAGSDEKYRAVAAREGVTLGPDFHAGGSNVRPDGSPDPHYRP